MAHNTPAHLILNFIFKQILVLYNPHFSEVGGTCIGRMILLCHSGGCFGNRCKTNYHRDDGSKQRTKNLEAY